MDLITSGGTLIEQTVTAPEYRLLRTGGADLGVPVLVAATDGVAIEVETWSLPAAAVPGVLARSSPAVALGRVRLADGRSEIGFVADPAAFLTTAPEDISAYGGWRSYLAAR